MFVGRQLVLSDVFTIAAETRHKRIGLEARLPVLEGGESSRSLCIVQYKRAAQWPPPCDGSGLPAVRTRRCPACPSQSRPLTATGGRLEADLIQHGLGLVPVDRVGSATHDVIRHNPITFPELTDNELRHICGRGDQAVECCGCGGHAEGGDPPHVKPSTMDEIAVLDRDNRAPEAPGIPGVSGISVTSYAVLQNGAIPVALPSPGDL